MSLPSFSVKRPVFVTMLTLIVIVIGMVSLSRLRIDLLPSVELPTVSVRTTYPGASPEVVERLVTQIVEEILATVPGVEEMTSSSSEGSSNVQLSFVWGTNLDAAVADVRSRLEDEISELPEDIERPQIRKFDVASFPVVIVGISSKMDPVELTDLIDKQVRYRFARVPGVAQADLFGGFEREIRVELDPVKVRALNLPLNQVMSAIRNANLDQPAGEIEVGQFEMTLRAPAEFKNLDEVRQTVVAMRDGVPVKLEQVGQVLDTYSKLTNIVRINGEKGLRIGIRKQSDANTVEVAEAILSEIERVNRDFPQIHVVPVVNQGNFIERSIENVARSVMYGGTLAILVLLFFLRNLRSTFVISVAIPISIIGTFALIYFGGFTLNLMTLGGLALGVGMMVDNSIVVLENIYRRREEEDEDTENTAIHGANEVSTAIVASTITTLVIFLPLVFTRGVTGILFRELAYVVSFSLLCSLAVSLILVPMLMSRLMQKKQPSPKNETDHNTASPRTNILLKMADRSFDHLTQSYHGLLQWALAHRWITLIATLLLLAGSVTLFPAIGTEFLPPSDEGEVRVSGEMGVGTRLSLIDQQARLIESVVYPAVPETVSSTIRIGPQRNGGAARAEIQLSLTPAAQRERSNTDIANDLRKRLNGKIPGVTIRTRAPQGQFLLERLIGGDTGLRIEIRGFDYQRLGALSERVAQMITDVPGITDVEVTREAGKPQEMILIDREKAADLGISARDISDALQIAVTGRLAGNYQTAGNAYRILVQMQDAELLSLDEILDLTVTSERGQDVALRNVVYTDSGFGPTVIDRKDQHRQIAIEANVTDRPMGDVAKDVQVVLDGIARPLGYELIVAGRFEQQQEAFAELLLSLGLALLLVYMVLACQYESLRDPLVVMMSVPLAAIGVLVMLFLSDTTLNVQSYIGCIMLGGIVVNNAILLVDQAKQLRISHQMNAYDAVTEAGRRRLRPILMTTLTTVLGLLPLSLGIGEGADAQAPMARAVIGGLATSTLITLVLIPVIYTLFHPHHEKSA